MGPKPREDDRKDPSKVTEKEFSIFKNGKLNMNHPARFNWLLGYCDSRINQPAKYHDGEFSILKNNYYATTEKYLHS